MYSFLKLNSSACCSSGGAYSLRVPNIPCQACEEGESPVHTPAVAPLCPGPGCAGACTACLNSRGFAASTVSGSGGGPGNRVCLKRHLGPYTQKPSLYMLHSCTSEHTDQYAATALIPLHCTSPQGMSSKDGSLHFGRGVQ